MQGSLTGIVVSNVFANGFFRLYRVHVTSSDQVSPGQEVTVSGNLGDLDLGATYRFDGHFASRGRFGRQFVVTWAQREGEEFRGRL